MVDVAQGSLYMAAADLAASAIEIAINEHVAPIIDQAVAEGKISSAHGIVLKKKGAKLGAGIVADTLAYHDMLREEAEGADIDVGAPADGKDALKGIIDSMVSPLGGTR